jgi:hypothetical protein
VNHKPSLGGSIRQTGTEKRKKEQEVAAPHKDIYVAIHAAQRRRKALIGREVIDSI